MYVCVCTYTERQLERELGSEGEEEGGRND